MSAPMRRGLRPQGRPMGELLKDPYRSNECPDAKGIETASLADTTKRWSWVRMSAPMRRGLRPSGFLPGDIFPEFVRMSAPMRRGLRQLSVSDRHDKVRLDCRVRMSAPMRRGLRLDVDGALRARYTV